MEKKMLKYEKLSQEISQQIEQAKMGVNVPNVAATNDSAIRRISVQKDEPTVWRPSFVQDVDKILHCPFYGRYADKTQVFSLQRNDDITRRSLHVQLVSRIARTIGSALHLNLDLIEAISLGHDIGHSPFAHTGEMFLNQLYHKNTGRHFFHNVHSVRVLDSIFPFNITLQTLSGILCHNGEQSCGEFYPEPLTSFEEFDKILERCYVESDCSIHLLPSTLEGCVVRLSDIIAYLGKDRQDANRTGLTHENSYTPLSIGSINAEIINNLVVNVIENSYGKNYLKLDDEHFKALHEAKKENYALIYNNPEMYMNRDEVIRPMMSNIYGQLLDDLKAGKKNSPIFKHHIDYILTAHYHRRKPYLATESNQIVVDYIASMTDDYFIDLHSYLFPESDHKVKYVGYFENDEYSI